MLSGLGRLRNFTPKEIVVFLTVLATIIFLAVSLSWHLGEKQAARKQQSPGAVIQDQNYSQGSTSKTIQGKYLFNGTIFWGRGIEKWSMDSRGLRDYSQPFSGLESFEPKKYDAWAADLECPVTGTHIPFTTQIEQLVFNCPPQYLEEAAKYFHFMNLANNHSGDQGLAGFSETRERLLGAGVQAFGHYDPAVAEDICEVAGLPVRLIERDEAGNEISKVSRTLPAAFCAWQYVFRRPLEGEMEVMKRYAEAMPVIAFLHMGGEYQARASGLQEELARKAVDLGASLVIANNPHWIQNSEVYKGRLVIYSTGNFIFDQLDYETQRSASLDVSLRVPYNQKMEQLLSLGDSCVKFRDDCLETIEKLGYPNYKPEFRFAIIAGDARSRVTTRAGAELQKAVEERLNWTETLRQLGQ